MTTTKKRLSPFQKWGRQGLLLAACFMGCIVGNCEPTAAQPPSTATTPTTPKIIATHLRGFGIPFQIDAADDSYIEVQLYLSRDRGKTWQFYGRQATDKAEFPFTADADGEYWFALKTLDRNRRLIPEGDPQPELIVQVDTVKPQLHFQIQTDAAGRVACRWQASDEHLDTASFQIAYRPVEANADAWTPVPVNLRGVIRNGVYSDQVAWWPDTQVTRLMVRMTIADRAGNTAHADRQVTLSPTPWRHRSQSTTLGKRTAPPTGPPALPQTTKHSQRNVLYGSVAELDPPHLHCKNGVCQLPPRKNDPHPSAPTGPPSHPLRPTPTNPQTSVARRFANGTPRTAGTGQANRLPLVGTPPEYAAPPVPEGPPPAFASLPADRSERVARKPAPLRPGSLPSGRSPRSIPWESEPERWTTPRQSTESTTLKPDPALPPQPIATRENKNDSLPAPNVATTKTVGNQVISESTTTWPSNQYRGIAPPAERSPAGVAKPDADRLATLAPRGESAPVADQTLASTPSLQQNFSPTSFSRPHPGGEATKPFGQRLAHRETDQPSRSVLKREVTPRSLEAATQMIGTKRFRLNYGIDAIDPSGVAKVDLWMTRDDGKTWRLWGTDSDNQSPIPVTVDEEGRYGFRIVVHSRDGLTGRGPSSGDVPDILVHIDTQAPLAQIRSVPYGRGKEAGRLVINYHASDPHLVLRPITLAYSENRQGPWIAIVQDDRNTGRYLWKPTADVPSHIYLRLDVRDRAGNVGVHILNQPIDVSGLVPRGTIHGVVPVGQ